MIDCPFDDCLSFEPPAKLADHIDLAHLTGRDPADELSLEQIESAISNLGAQTVTGMEILQLPSAHELLGRARIDARPEAEIVLRLVLGRALLEASA
jgi:hypothetical protein